ncbi:MAG: glycoside hydrolase family 3 protein [Clostridiales bacterium]|nr:glycoside hydrolase family 3 protein [Clostridiales bacterium]
MSGQNRKKRRSGLIPYLLIFALVMGGLGLAAAKFWDYTQGSTPSTATVNTAPADEPDSQDAQDAADRAAREAAEQAELSEPEPDGTEDAGEQAQPEEGAPDTEEAQTSPEEDAQTGPDTGDTETEQEQTTEEDTSEPAEQEDTSVEPDNASRALTVDEAAQVLLEGMTLHEKVCQLFIVTPEELTGISGTATVGGASTKSALQDYPVGGLVYFAGNILTPDQCTSMIENTQSYSQLGLFIAVDEEGGTVARIGRNSAMGTTSFPNMATVGAQGTDAAYNVGLTIGSEITQFGFNLDFAPVADVNTNPDNPVIGSRAFSSDAEKAAELVASAVQGFRDGGILCCLKHFPGHGDTATDSHYGLAETTKTLDELRETEFLPFQAGIDAGAELVMVGHISTPNITGDSVPASLSSYMVTDILRGELGFDGLVVTDSLSMEAVTDQYGSGEAAVLAVQAGVDLLLMPEDLSAAVSALESAVDNGTLTESRIDESVLRILSVKLEYGIIDIRTVS